MASVRAVRDFSGPAEYPCVRRFRHRRLATFLALSGFRDTFRALIDETDAFMFGPHLCQLVERGLWEDAANYLSRFLTTRRRSDEAQVLRHFLRIHNIAAGKKDGAVQYLLERYKLYAPIRTPSIIVSMLCSGQVSAARASLDWEHVRCKAADIVKDLVYRIPELKGLVLLPPPGGSMMPHNVLPIGFGFRRRHHVKRPCRPRASALAKLYLEKKRRLPSSSHHQELHRRLSTKAKYWLADLLDESLKAGIRLNILYEWFLSGKEGTNKHLTQEGCHNESARHGFKRKKNPEQTIVEECIDTKKQRTTGAFGEASTASVTDLGAEEARSRA